jgi:hypothetical protein
VRSRKSRKQKETIRKMLHRIINTISKLDYENLKKYVYLLIKPICKSSLRVIAIIKMIRKKIRMKHV